MSTTEDATPFEAALAQLGDAVVEYEATRYKEQRLVAFSNWPTTDPFVYSLVTTNYRFKASTINVEHIQPTTPLSRATLLSYHIYPYFPDYLESEIQAEAYAEAELEEVLGINETETLRHRLSCSTPQRPRLSHSGGLLR